MGQAVPPSADKRPTSLLRRKTDSFALGAPYGGKFQAKVKIFFSVFVREFFFFSWTSCLEWRDKNECCGACVRVAAEPDQGEGNAAPPPACPAGKSPSQRCRQTRVRAATFPFFSGGTAEVWPKDKKTEGSEDQVPVTLYLSLPRCRSKHEPCRERVLPFHFVRVVVLVFVPPLPRKQGNALSSKTAATIQQPLPQ